MTTFFVDTSALSKRYIVETGTIWVRSWINPLAGNVVVFSELAIVEMFSLLARKQRERHLTMSDLARLQRAFLWHTANEYVVDLLNTPVVTSARSLISKYPLRALDAIQLASALDARTILSEPLVFISADRNLLVAAGGEGFTVDDPNAHP